MLANCYFEGLIMYRWLCPSTVINITTGTTDGVSYLATEALERFSCKSLPGEEQITFNYMNDLDAGYSRYLDSVLLEIDCCTITSEEDSPEEHLMNYIRTVVKGYDSE